jgi:hypothetical protein
MGSELRSGSGGDESAGCDPDGISGPEVSGTLPIIELGIQ